MADSIQKTNSEAGFYALPMEGFVRIWQVTGCKKRGIPPIIPESRSSFWAKVKNNIYPKPVKMGGCTVWPVEEIRALVKQIQQGAGGE